MGKNQLKLEKERMHAEYDEQDIGIKFDDIMKAIQGVNENKAVMGILKP